MSASSCADKFEVKPVKQGPERSFTVMEVAGRFGSRAHPISMHRGGRRSAHPATLALAASDSAAVPPVHARAGAAPNGPEGSTLRSATVERRAIAASGVRSASLRNPAPRSAL